MTLLEHACKQIYQTVIDGKQKPACLVKINACLMEQSNADQS